MKGVAKVARGKGNVELIDVPEPEARAGHVCRRKMLSPLSKV